MLYKPEIKVKYIRDRKLSLSQGWSSVMVRNKFILITNIFAVTTCTVLGKFVEYMKEQINVIKEFTVY